MTLADPEFSKQNPKLIEKYKDFIVPVSFCFAFIITHLARRLIIVRLFVNVKACYGCRRYLVLETIFT